MMKLEKRNSEILGNFVYVLFVNRSSCVRRNSYFFVKSVYSADVALNTIRKEMSRISSELCVDSMCMFCVIMACNVLF